jgi:integrase
MKKHHPENERMKRKYLWFLRHARRRDEATLDSAAAALARFEIFTGHLCFKTFTPEQAVAFKEHLKQQNSRATGKKLSKGTLNSTLAHLKQFFQWLWDKPGYRSRFDYSDAEFFNLTEKDVRTANATRPRPAATLEQVRYVLACMPARTAIERRDRALVAFALLTGARVGAIVSLKLKHLSWAPDSVFQDSRDVDTKFGKTFMTYFFRVGDEVLAVFKEWVDYLRKDLLWGDDDPLFPATVTKLDPTTLQFAPVGIGREHWATTTPVRQIFKTAFRAAGLDYFNPHSLRKTIVRHALTLCRSAEQVRAVSQNLGHENVNTTLSSYGELSYDRQGEVIRAIATECTRSPNLEALSRHVAAFIIRSGEFRADDGF